VNGTCSVSTLLAQRLIGVFDTRVNAAASSVAEAVRGDPGRQAGLAAEPADLFAGGLVAVAALAVAGDEDPAGGAAVDVVVEGSRRPAYRSGQRQRLKVRAYETTEVIVGAVAGTLERPTSVITGRYTLAGELVIVGRTGLPTGDQIQVLAGALTPTDNHPWPSRIGAGTSVAHRSTWSASEPTSSPRSPLTRPRQAGRWRHQLRLVRLRSDLKPDQVPQQETGATASWRPGKGPPSSVETDQGLARHESRRVAGMRRRRCFDRYAGRGRVGDVGCARTSSMRPSAQRTRPVRPVRVRSQSAAWGPRA
jgi:hypothetical protein